MQIAIPLYDRFTALDAVGPYEVLSRIPGATLTFVAARPGPQRSDTGRLTLVAEASLEEIPEPDVLLVPGCPGARARELIAEAELLDWIRHAHTKSQWTTSVCTGALQLGAAGVLDGIEATTHWLELERLAEYGARPVERRVVEQGRVITAAGVSAGIDMGLTLVARLAGEDAAKALQLGIEYDPEPPFDTGSTRTAPQRLIEMIRSQEEGGDAQ